MSITAGGDWAKAVGQPVSAIRNANVSVIFVMIVMVVFLRPVTRRA